MATDYTTLSLPQVFAELGAISDDARETFGDLNAGQINWKPSEDKWSVGQCLEHLIGTNREFYPTFDRIVRGEKKTTLWQRMPALPAFFGKMMVKSLSPGSSQKFKAPASVRPTTSAVDPRIVDRFIAHQREVSERMRELEKFDPAKIIIYSPFAKVITYSVLDACRLIAAHERRHFAQAERVMEMPGFPR